MKNNLTREGEGIGTIQETENIVCEVIWGRQVSSPQANTLERQGKDGCGQLRKRLFISTVAALNARCPL